MQNAYPSILSQLAAMQERCKQESEQKQQKTEYMKAHKFQIGDWVVLDQERVRIANVYVSGAGKPMYTIGSSLHGELDIEAEDIDINN